jgi:hypothetical protein
MEDELGAGATTGIREAEGGSESDGRGAGSSGSSFNTTYIAAEEVACLALESYPATRC